MIQNTDAAAPDPNQESIATTRKRPKPGERRNQILETLAHMLEKPDAERITTAALAAELSVSEAALYRHFASKAQMFEALIEFIEHAIFGLINQINERETTPSLRAARILTTLLQFAEKNPGMARVMVGDALVFENARLQQRMNLLFDKVEASLRQCLRLEAQEQSSATPTVEANIRASIMVAFAIGRMQRYVRSEFKQKPSDHLDACIQQLTPQR